jgi:hypothetical protein
MLLPSNFVPTWLYIKQHNKTGLKYFGKTIRKDPIKYLGSGTYWTNHLNIHGADVTTIWCRLFTNKEELTEYALNFSKNNNIVESKEWANLEYEDGLSGSGLRRKNSIDTIEKRRIKNTGKKRTATQRNRMSEAQKNRTPHVYTDDEITVIGNKISNALKGRVMSDDHKQKLSESLRGKMLGVVKSEETKQKMRKPKTPEHRKAISDARKAKYEALRQSRSHS